MAVRLCIVYGSFCAIMVELSNCDRNRRYGQQSLKYLLSGYLQKQLAYPFPRERGVLVPQV